MSEVQAWRPRAKPVEKGAETVVVVLPPEGTPLVAAPSSRSK